MERVALDQVDQSKKKFAQAQRTGMDDNQRSASCNYRERAVDRGVQSDSASGTAHTHMKNLKLISCRVFANVSSC